MNISAALIAQWLELPLNVRRVPGSSPGWGAIFVRFFFIFKNFSYTVKFLLNRNLRFEGCLIVDYSALAVYHKQSSLEGFLIKVARTV